jgi:hypothetical protein
MSPDQICRLRIGSVHLHSLGARAVGEFLAELGRKYDIEDEVLDQLEEWNRLTPELLRAAGGDRWPLPVLAGGRR